MNKTNSRATITTEAAQLVVAACQKKAQASDGAYSITVCDESGNPKASVRMDGAPVQSIQVAADKAYTAAGFGMTTDEWFEFANGDDPLRLGATSGIPRLVVFGGGYPLTVDDVVVGAVGVSGGHWSDDMEIAKAGLAAFTEA